MRADMCTWGVFSSVLRKSCLVSKFETVISLARPYAPQPPHHRLRAVSFRLSVRNCSNVWTYPAPHCLLAC